MTSASTLCTRQLDRVPEPAGGVTVGDPDPFVAPAPSHRMADAPLRTQVVLHGVVLDVHDADWVGGPVLEVTLSDGTGDICLAFFGRHRIGGIELGRPLRVAGALGIRHGRSLMMNPQSWLDACDAEPADA